MRTSGEVIDPKIDPKSLPYKEYPLDNRSSYLVTTKFLRCHYKFNKDKGAFELVR